MTMALKVLLHHSYAEVFGTPCTIEQFRKELEPYSADSVILLCSYLNFICEWLQFQPEPIYADLLIASAFHPKIAERLVREQRPVFHRRQCLLIAKEAARYARGSVDPTLIPSLGNFGQVFLMANDLFYRDIEAVDLNQERAKLLVNWLGLVEYLNSSLKDALVRSDRIVATVESLKDNSHRIDIAGLFEEGTGITPALYRSFCVAVLSFYISTDKAKAAIRSSGVVNWAACCDLMKLPQDWLSTTALSPDELQRCASITVADKGRIGEFLNSYDQGLEDFTVFRNYPLFNLGDSLAMIDSGFLVEKCETGLFWKVHEGLKSKQKKASLSFWGDVVEKYVNWLLLTSATPGLNDVVANPVYASGEEVSDAAITCADRLVLIECKGGFFGAPAKYSGDPEKLQVQIRLKLVENAEKKPKGVQQLANAINFLFGQPSKVAKDLNIPKVKAVFPVLVVRDDVAAAPVINIILGQEFEAKLDRNKLKVEVKPLVVLSVRVLEFICRYLADASLSDIVDARISSDPHLLSPFWLVPNTVIDQVGAVNNKAVDAEFRRIVLEIARSLFSSATTSEQNGGL